MKILIDEQRLQARIAEMAKEIDAYYEKQKWYRTTQEPVVVIGVLSGAIFLMADLVRKLSIRIKLDYLRISNWSYSMSPKISSLPDTELCNAHILLIEDILDTGETLRKIYREFGWENPSSMKTCVLLRKPDKAPDDIVADFVGFDVPDEFLIGYGLDYNGRYREMPCVAVWSEDESFASKKKLAEISKSTGTKHVKVLISELCVVMQFLLKEMEQVKFESQHPLRTHTFPGQNPVPKYPDTNLSPTETGDPPFTPGLFKSPPIKNPFDARRLEGDSE